MVARKSCPSAQRAELSTYRLLSNFLDLKAIKIKQLLFR